MEDQTLKAIYKVPSSEKREAQNYIFLFNGNTFFFGSKAKQHLSNTEKMNNKK